MKKIDPDKFFKPMWACSPCRPIRKPCKAIKKPCRPILLPCRPINGFDKNKLHLLDEIDEYFDRIDLQMASDILDDFDFETDWTITRTTENGIFEKMTFQAYLEKYWDPCGFRKCNNISQYAQVADASEKIQANQKAGKPWRIDRNPKFPRANCLALKVFNISDLAAEIHLAPDEALGEKGWLRDEKGKILPKGTKIEAGKIYTVPNVWITADLMEGGDIIDKGINIGGTIGRNFNTHKPDKAKELMVKDLNNLIPEINKHAGNIYGMILYAHGTKSGYISNIANHLKFLIGWEVGNFKKLHTMRLLEALKQNGFRIAIAYPMQCFSIFKGDFTFTTGEVFYKGKKYSAQEVISIYIRKIRNDSGLTPGLCYSDSNGKESVTYSVDWKHEWKRRAIKVDGYSGVNVMGIDL